MSFKKLVLLTVLAMVSTFANADLNIHHREGSAPIGKFHLKVLTMDGKLCYERTVVDEFTQKVSITQDQLSQCGEQGQYAIYGVLHGWIYDATYYGDKYPKNSGECTVSHEKVNYLWSKLGIKCSS